MSETLSLSLQTMPPAAGLLPRCSPAVVIADDIEEFGLETAVALSELPADIARLNRNYRRIVAQRALRVLPEIAGWHGRTVQVFLRHDEVFVFALACGDLIGMTNHVILRNAMFVVDTAGRRQTLRQEGPLPNHTTVHAFVAGELCHVSDSMDIPDLSGWEPVIYRPSANEEFTLSRTGRPVYRARRILMVPGRTKVWCQDVDDPGSENITAGSFGATP